MTIQKGNINYLVAIEAAPKKLKEVLDPEQYEFIIPGYQRPYAWKEANAEELLSSLLDAFGENESAEEYFLGTIVLINKKGQKIAEVIDGQQRLTTLTILYSVLRHCIPENELESRARISSKIRSGEYKNYGLRPRKLDAKFFEEKIQSEQSIENLLKSDIKLSKSQEAMRDNALAMRKKLIDYTSKIPEAAVGDWIRGFFNRIIENTWLVVIAADDMAKGYEIFRSMNGLGLSLEQCDIVKAWVIEGLVPENLEPYTQKWEQEEEDLSRDDFQLLFSHIHRILIKGREDGKKLLDTYKNRIINEAGSCEKFIDEILVPYSNNLEVIINASYGSTNHDNQYAIRNKMEWLNNATHSDWQPAAIHFLKNFGENSANTKTFFEHLDRATFASVLSKDTVNERTNRYRKIIEAIDLSSEKAIQSAYDSVSLEDIENVTRSLSGDIYGKSYCLYTLMRLDSLLADQGESPALKCKKLTVEHVLPQTMNEYWSNLWKNPDHHDYYKNKIGNLVLLSKRKNSRAQNFDFDTKKDTYFKSKETGATEISAFPLTLQVIACKKWDLKTVKQKQEEYINLLCEKLDMKIPNPV